MAYCWAGWLVGPIPARAGQPSSTSLPFRSATAYPRSRGATKKEASAACPALGLSPLARGNPALLQTAPDPAGPIPARAGQPMPWNAGCRLSRAYPRSRGATGQHPRACEPDSGLSPLARGNRGLSVSPSMTMGPIPARAGQPFAGSAIHCPTGAYPRSRGATSGAAAEMFRLGGLSPLARGNRRSPYLQGASRGPIPARAGQPCPARGARRGRRAYPRSRGATVAVQHIGLLAQGLSPLARGNLQRLAYDEAPAGPIPARAGQPASGRRRCGRFRAYPRSRGATGVLIRHRPAAVGLSPLARGNLSRRDAQRLLPGPIPARAGQPRTQRRRSIPSWAYPRSRGATEMPTPLPSAISGLSPLARGNRNQSRTRWPPLGPIPARAGQPTSWTKRLHGTWAYPRSRGATGHRPVAVVHAPGLSPLARGNLGRHQVGAGRVGPIPARAGQPRRRH